MFNKTDMLSQARDKMKENLEWIETKTMLQGIEPVYRPNIIVRLRKWLNHLIGGFTPEKDRLIIEPKFKDKRV